MKKLYFLLVALLFATSSQAAQNPTPSEILDSADRSGRVDGSPVRRVERQHRDRTRGTDRRIRTIEGNNNNLQDPEMNAHGTQLLRITPADYADGFSALAGADRPGPREISNAVHAQGDISVLSPANASDYLWQWGQFLDHDLDLTEGDPLGDTADIPIPTGDETFDPDDLGNQVFSFTRSVYDTATGIDSPREQLNEITGWIDASNVYGSDAERAAALRTNDGTGMLKTSEGNLLPLNVDELPNAGGPRPDIYLAGDVRANEQIGLTAMHTLFVREHNRIAAELANNRRLSGEQIYQRARAIVGAQMQVITYNEFLPLLLGPDAIPEYEGYDPSVDARVTNEFSTAAYRLGHSMLSSQIYMIHGSDGVNDPLPLREAFFAAPSMFPSIGIEPVLRGLAAQTSQNIDHLIVDDVRNFLFRTDSNIGFDLASLNIQRGRDHGLSGYIATREALGFDEPIGELNSVAVSNSITSVYGDSSDLDLWTLGLAEAHVEGALVGPTFHEILTRQFIALRDGDRFWYQRSLRGRTLREVENTTLADIIRRNTDIEEIQDNVFIAVPVEDTSD